MDRTPQGRRGLGGRRARRGAVAAFLAVVLMSGVASAAPATGGSTRISKQDVTAAEQRLAALNDRLDQVTQLYDKATVDIGHTQARLTTLRAEFRAASAAEEAARQRLSQVARTAYENSGAQMEMVLGTSSTESFVDAMEFLDALNKQNADAAARYQTLRTTTAAIAARVADALRAKRAQQAELATRRSQVESGINEQQSLVARLKRQLTQQEIADAIARREAARRAAIARQEQLARQQQQQQALAQQQLERQRQQQSHQSTGGSSGGNSGGGSPPPPPPPPPGHGAAAALAAARSVLGVPYVFGAADPNVGFDCSGLTMWSWAHAGVHLAHFAAYQYREVHHVARSQLQPGDLLFFFSDIHHVAMYIGGGMMISADHPGSVVRIEGVWWDLFIGGGRP